MSFLHNPISDVQSIANNLRDRYKSGFPILKEIVQNADDAKAQNLIIGWHPGLKDVDHPLLKDPGFFFVNDAPLTEADVKGIRTLGLGSKADDTNAVGKFGLGMKSLFHLGELYFFIGSDWQEYQGKYPKADVLNPWDELRKEWNSFSDLDKKAIQQALSPVTNAFNDDAYVFIVWIPLRSVSIAQARGEDGNNYIYNSEDYGREVPNFLTDSNLASQLGQLFPMLKHLRTIQGCSFAANESDPRELFSTEIEQPIDRIHFPTINGEEEWSGSIRVNSYSAEQAKSINYVGNESILVSEQLNQLKENKFWPISYARDALGKEQKVQDKAQPHSATILLATPSAAQAKLTVRWAVFLPLGEQDTSEEKQVFEVAIAGNTSFDILLHGYFFIDAGRVGIHGRKSIGYREALDIDSEDTATQEWNRLLANEGTLPSLLVSVALAASKWRLNTQQVDSLAWGIQQFLKHRMGSPCHEPITSKNQWVYRLQSSSKSWDLVDISRPVRILPKPNSDEYERIWQTLPALMESADEFVYIENEKPNIISSNNACWQQHELVRLFESVKSEIFESQKLLGYLADFLHSLNHESIYSDRCQSVLIQLAQSAFKSIPLTKLSLNGAAIRRFVGYIRSSSRWAVKLDKEEQPLWNVFASVKSSKLFVPAFLDGEIRRSSGALSFDDADGVLSQLGMQELNDKQLGKVTDTILDNFKGKEKQRLLQHHDSLKLFLAYVAGSQSAYRESLANLMSLFQQKRLFSISSGERFILGEVLGEALEHNKIVFINSKVNQQLFDGRVELCNTVPVLKLLATKPELKAPKDRSNLISKLEISESLSSEQKLAVRYLVHGHKNDYSLSEQLWSIGGDHEVWSRLHKNCLSIEQSWTLISHELAVTLKLTPQEKKVVNLEEVNAQSVLAELGEDIQYLEFDELSLDEHDAEIVLEKIEDAELWRKLSLHRCVEGKYHSVNDNCFLETNIELPDEIRNQITWIVSAHSQAVQRQQKDNIKKLDHSKIIELVLKHENPSQFQDYILTLVGKLASDAPVFELLVTTNWLTSGNKVLSPNMVLDSKQTDWPAISELSKVNSEFCFVDELDTYGSTCFDSIRNMLVVSDVDIAKLAIKAASRSQGYAIGQAPVTTSVLQQACKYPQIFRQLDYKGWELLVECFNNAPEGILSDDELSQLSSSADDTNKLVALHEALVKAISSPDSVQELRAVILAMICRQPEPLKSIANLTLRSKSNEFIESRMLCFGVEGITHSSLLHEQDYSAIKHVLKIVEPSSISGEELEQHFNAPRNQTSHQTSSYEQIKRYFVDWAPFITNTTAIGSVLALMSGNPGIRALCEGYIGSRNIEQFIGSIGENWRPKSGTPDNLANFVSKVDFDIRPDSGSTIEEDSILGERIEVNLSEEADSIFVWSATRVFYSAPITVQLRKLPIYEMSEEKLLKILKRSAELFLEKIYLQRITLDHIWDKFSGAEQLDIHAAKLIVLDGIVQQLKELRLEAPKIRSLLSENNDLLVASAESNCLYDQDAKHRVLVEIGEEIEQESTKAELLTAIKEKVLGDQYEPASVPFELFQNADDAVLELEDLGYPKEEIHRRGVFKVSVNDEVLSFMHWGREVNQHSSSHISSSPKSSTFKMDLQKMLVRNQSDKEGSATGKFGLGFKSCLLISDTPNIISGRLAVQIEGGLLPVLSPKHEELFEQARNEPLNKPIRPTIISLPLNKGVNANRVLESFKIRAGLVSVFAKKIHTIELNGELFTWEPTLLSSMKGLKVGNIQLPSKKGYQLTKILQIETDSGRFIFGLSGKGFTPLGKKIPKLWNLAPLMGDFGIGIAINADFQVDKGRNHLHVSSTSNDPLFEKLGRELKSRLEAIYQETKLNWQAVRTELQLDEDLSIIDFWGSLWKAMWGGGPKLPVDGEKTVDHTYRLFQGEGGIVDFYYSFPVFPTGLKSGSTKLTTLKSFTYQTSDLLEQLLAHLERIPTVSRLLESNKLVCNNYGKQLNKLGLELATLDLSQVLDMTLDNGELTPALAEQLQPVFNPEFEKALKNNKATHEQVDDFRKKLGELKIQTRNGSYRGIKHTLLTDKLAANSDEEKVIKFTPDEYIAAESYTNSKKLLEFCRRDTTPYNVDMLHDWACRNDLKENPNKVRALCEYIVSGDLSGKLAELIKTHAKPNWIWDIDVKHLEKWGWNKKQIDMFRNVRLVSDKEVERRVSQQLKSEGQSSLSTKEALMKIYNWWVSNRDVELTNYQNRLYPSGVFDWESIKLDEQPDVYKPAWLKLFFLGSCQTIGRTTEQQHSAALKHFEDKGWWSVFSDVNDPSKWFDVMDQYLEQAVTSDTYRTWLQILPLYRFSSHLEDYIELFWMAEQGMPNIKALIQPASSAELSGAGSSFAPPELKATLGIGANFILRELYRYGVYSDESVEKHCFVASQGVRDILSKKLHDPLELDKASADSSEKIYSYLCLHMGEEFATFDGGFDIPLRLLARDDKLLENILEIGVWN
ncbi:sacsin N-terminal ATP-binding-like domain-containing protein [Vibrio sp. 10N.222.54.B11]|uniref:sacsin N-terminal ATP-binding-like domain-containing protein n=1 Tax=Vibrio sp. 10N.222.54.B11 TaxID=3229635 RepID=UPI003554218B